MGEQLPAKPRINWTKGLARLYVLWVGGWVAYWFVYLPLHTAMNHPDSWAAARRVLAGMAEPSILLMLLVIALLPVPGYLVVRLLFLIGSWVVRGFAAPRQ